MAYARYLIEIGQGVDMHGGDNTNAALKALKDATHHCCMAGIHDIFHLTLGNGSIIHVKADIYAPTPDSINKKPLMDYLSAYSVDLNLYKGGASAQGLYMPSMGDGDHITIVIAVLTVYVDV